MPEPGVTFGKKTLRDLKVERGMPVLLRVDFNVPLKDGQVTDDARIRAALPAIEQLREAGAKVIACSHLGRPKGADPATSLAPVSERLGELIGARVYQAPEVIGPEARRGAARLEPGEVLVLENTRWESGETKNDPNLAAAAGRAGRGVRAGRVRIGPSRARLDRGHRASTCRPTRDRCWRRRSRRCAG